MECRSVVKAFALLELLADRPAEAAGAARENGGAPLRDLADRAGLKRPTAHRLLGTLAALGYVSRTTPGVYRLARPWPGAATGAAGRRGGAQVDPATLARLAQPELRSLHRLTTETVNLGVLRGGRVEYLLVLESRHPLRRVVKPGATDPFHTTALGRAIAAHLPEAQREALLRSLGRRAAAEAMRRTLAEVARQGWAVEQDETDVGVTCLGAPVLFRGEPVAAVSISAPTARVDARRRREWAGHLCRAAREISKSIITKAKD